MSGWIKWEKDLESDPRFIRLVRHVRNRCVTDVTQERYVVTTTAGALLRFWSYADTHIRENDQLDMGFEDIDELVGLDGFAEGIPEDWLVKIDETTVELPGYQEHNGVEARKRDLTAKRMQRKRLRDRDDDVTRARNGSVTGASPDQTRPDQDQTKRKSPSDSVGLKSKANGKIDSKAIERVFAHWRETHNHPRASLDEKRRKLIARALKGYDEALVCQSITGYLNSPHHMGQNDRGTKFDDIELLLRDAKHIDQGLKFYSEPPRLDQSTLTQRNVKATEKWEPPEVRNAPK